jgi:predicted secreted protein
MAAYKGNAMLLKIGATPGSAPASDVYTTVAGLRSTGITHNEETIDVTTKDSSQVRQLPFLDRVSLLMVHHCQHWKVL